MSVPLVIDKLNDIFTDAASGQRAPDEDALQSIGGWPAIIEAAPLLVDQPLLSPTLMLCVRELHAGRIDDRTLSASTALVDAVVATTDAKTFADGLEVLLRSDRAIETIGGHLADALAPITGPPAAGATRREIERHASALEGTYRLAAGAVGSRRRLLFTIEQIGSPQPLRYARALVRVVPAAIDLWPDADDLSVVLDRLCGACTPSGGMPAAGTTDADTYVTRTGAITEDAAVATANVALIRALRALSASSAAEQITRAQEQLELVRPAGRDDVEILLEVLAVLGGIVTAHLRGEGVLNPGALTPQVAAALRERVRHWLVAGSGLTHWATTGRSDAYIAWSQLADDLVELAGHIGRDALYDAGAVMGGILRTYVRARRFAVVAHDDDLGTLWTLIQPSVEDGFAARAGLFSNLLDHSRALEARLLELSDGSDAREDLEGELHACRQLSAAARAAMSEPARPAGKAGGDTSLVGGSPSPGEFTFLNRLFPGGYEGLVDGSIAQRIDNALTVTGASQPESSAELKAVARVRTALENSVDYHGDQRTAVDYVLGLLVRFVADRANIESKVRAYLFNARATEADLHDDLKDFLTSTARIQIERSNVAGGRCDIEVSFNGFHLYIELKADDSLTPLSDKRAWVNQTASYMSTDVRIGFLMALRRHRPGTKRPDMHLSEVVGHTTVKVPGDTHARQVVTLSVIGNSATPSQMSATGQL